MTEHKLLDGKRVLLVDDEADILDTLEDLLPMCEIMRASNFKDAKDCLETLQIDLTILDIMGVDGYKLLEIANEKGITAVMLTAHALSPENVVKSFKEGAASYLPKEEMVNIASFLNDVLEDEKTGKNPWTRWYDRMGSFFEERFGDKWKDNNKEFWEKFPFY